MAWYQYGLIESLLFLATINVGIAEAQIIRDGTIPTKIEEVENMIKITGGERVGNNLFHSFEEFSIPAGMEAIFENAADIQNIFTRITGSEVSFIDGLLQTAGGANFFLINPNGIVFGENAIIDVGGSFVATTANSIEFADGKTFSARQDKPILTWNAPIGLGLDGNNGSIAVNGTGNQLTNESNFAPIESGQTQKGISVPDGQTLALVGNTINFNSGVITTKGGKIYITSVESGAVDIEQSDIGITLIDNATTKYQDINLNQKSLLYSFEEGKGAISLIGQNINIVDGSFILSQNPSSISGGSLNVNASESLTLSGQSSEGNLFSSIRSETLGNNMGGGADINISTSRLVLLDEARIQASTFNDAVGGNINVKASNSIQLNNASISSTIFAGGDAGNIQLSTPQLKIINSGLVTSSTFGKEDGNGGNLTINTNSIEVIGGSTTERSSISSSSFNAGNAGNLTINTLRLEIFDGASVSSSSFGTGNAGNLNINASESINVSGINNNLITTNNPQSRIRSAIEATSPAGQQAFGLPAVPPGDAGNLIIKTPILNVTQEGVISVENQGTGSAGTLSINADNLNLDQTGRITAAAESGLGGNIVLNTQNLNITKDSQITASAGGNENGGNITINTTNLTAKKTIE